MLYKLLLLFFFCLAFTSCSKTRREPDFIIVDLGIISTTTPATQTQGEDIISRVLSSGPNLCYTFLKFEINEAGTRQFTIRVKGTFPNPQNGNAFCLDAVYYKDTTFTLRAETKGQYLLHFYKEDNLFKTDTVMVN